MGRKNENQEKEDPNTNSGNELDSRLMNRNSSSKKSKDESAKRAGALKENKRKGNLPQANPAMSLREMVRAKKAAGGKNAKDSASSADAPSPVRKGTSKLLQQAWINLIDSFGLTLIWINIHVFLRMIFGEKYFVKLGGEWADGNNVAQAGKSIGAVAEGTGGKVADKIKKAEQTMGITEGMGLACLDLGCLLSIILTLAFLSFIFGIWSYPLEMLAKGALYVWETLARLTAG